MVAQLVKRSLPTPEVRGAIPIGDINIDQYSTNCNLEKTKIKKEAGYGPSLKKKTLLMLSAILKIAELYIQLSLGGKAGIKDQRSHRREGRHCRASR